MSWVVKMAKEDEFDFGLFQKENVTKAVAFS